MNSQLIDPTMARNMADSAEMQQKQREIDAMRREMNGGAPKDKKAKLREACEGFEAVFIQKMWEQMRATVPEQGFLHSKDEKIWQGMYDQELSKKMAGAGGIGLADMMMAQLGRNLEDAGQKALDTNLRRSEPLPIQPAPLLFNPEPATPAPAPQAPKTAAADIYSGDAPLVAAMQTEEEPAPVAPSELDSLVSKLQTEMQQPVVNVTRITTNARSLDSFNTVRANRPGFAQPPRVEVARPPQASPAPVRVPPVQPEPSLSPTSVSEARSAGLDPMPGARPLRP